MTAVIPGHDQNLSPSEVAARIEEVLRRSGMDLSALRVADREYRLSPEKQALLLELEGLEWLLGK